MLKVLIVRVTKEVRVQALRRKVPLEALEEALSQSYVDYVNVRILWNASHGPLDDSTPMDGLHDHHIDNRSKE